MHETSYLCQGGMLKLSLRKQSFDPLPRDMRSLEVLTSQGPDFQQLVVPPPLEALKAPLQRRHLRCMSGNYCTV